MRYVVRRATGNRFPNKRPSAMSEMIDPFAPETYSHEENAATQKQAMSLFELNVMVRTILQHTMSETYWVAAEISELRVASNGHCYLELVQKDGFSGSLVAKAGANIWRKNYVQISTQFEQATGQRLAAGLKVMVRVRVTFHELYGYSLNVVDIDPTYTLGDLERRRREILRQLEDDGVIDLNKELPLPRILSRIAVVSSHTAAGFGDFCKQLEQSGFGFKTKLFEAAMQGDKVEATVIGALNRIAEEQDDWDAVVIIRGGGATTDLNGFDSYLLASNVAQFPLPVFTGIGHERDDTIIDRVAHTRFKTPTAVAAFLIERRTDEKAQLISLQQRLAQSLQRRMHNEQQRLNNAKHELMIGVTQNVHGSRQRFDVLTARYRLAHSRFVNRQRERVLRYTSRVEVVSQTYLQRQHHQLEQYPVRMMRAVENILQRERLRVQGLEKSLKLAGPERILSLGFSITTKQGKAVRSADELNAGDELTTRFAQGSVTSVVKKKNSIPDKE